MKSIFKLIVYIIVFILALLVLAPKESLYNLLEKELSKKEIIISNEKRDEKLLSLDINDAKVYYQGIEVSNINRTSFFTFLFYTEVKVKDVRFLDSFSRMFPSPVNDITIKHSVLNYDKVFIESKGAFGVVEGHINLLSREVKIYLDASSTMKSSYSKILRTMKLKDGRYIYEYKF